MVTVLRKPQEQSFTLNNTAWVEETAETVEETIPLCVWIHSKDVGSPYRF
jgi:hypothetical protein